MGKNDLTLSKLSYPPLVVPEASKKLLNELPGEKTLEITAKYPTVEGWKVSF